MILLHPYVRATRDDANQAPTWVALQHIESVWADPRHRLLHVPVGDDSRYEDAVRHWWGRDTLIICEQDIVPPPSAVWHLEHCPYPLCAWVYPLWHRRDVTDWTGLGEIWDVAQKHPDPLVDDMDRQIREAAALYGHAPEGPGPAYPTWAHRVIDDPADPVGTQRWIETGEGWADLAALGLTKIARGIQQMAGQGWSRGSWHNLDSRISWYLYFHGYGPWHLHWPAIPHNHRDP